MAVIVFYAIWSKAAEMQTKLCIVLITCYCIAAVEITEHPVDVTAFVGQSVLIRCQYEGTSNYPYWIINGVLYPPLDLPPYYINVYNRGLRIPYVASFMNKTDFICSFSSDIKSKAGYLFILGHNITFAPTSIQLTSHLTPSSSSRPATESARQKNELILYWCK